MTYLNPQVSKITASFFGGGEGIRTPDPRVANAVLCQLSYTPSFQISKVKFQIYLKPEIQNRDPSERLVAGAGFEPATFGL